MLRVVIDTSTFVSFVLTSGNITRQIISAWRSDEFVLLTTSATTNELRRVLERPRIKARSQSSLSWVADAVDRFSIHVPGELTLAGATRDPKDDMFLACAVEGHADYLVSSDRDLLVLREYAGICILNPGEFLITLHLARLSPSEMKSAFSRDGLLQIQSSLCMDQSLRKKVAEALGWIE